MKIFLTGGNGYIGTNLARFLVEKNHLVVALLRQIAEPDSVKNPRIKWVHGNILDYHKIKQSMEGCDAVIHLAAFVKPWHDDEQHYYYSNVTGTQNLLQAAVVNKVSRFVMVSTAGVFGCNHVRSITEEDKLDWMSPIPYIKSKLAAETLTQTFVEKGLHSVIVNPARVYGPGPNSVSSGVNFMLRMMKSYGVALIPVNGNAIGSYCFMEDVVEGIYNAMYVGKPGKRYLMGGANISYNDLVKSVSRIIQKPVCKIIIPRSAGKVIGNIEVLRGKYSTHNPLITPEWFLKYSTNQIIDSSLAKLELNYQVRPIQQGLTETLDWITRK
jgi:nucleoside-diphosphate-sugar epimerase